MWLLPPWTIWVVGRWEIRQQGLRECGFQILRREVAARAGVRARMCLPFSGSRVGSSWQALGGWPGGYGDSRGPSAVTCDYLQLARLGLDP